jgi:hypothetical protein
MITFFCKLNPPRPTFALDMTPEEARVMGDHAVYWKAMMDRGYVVTFGLVGDPAGPYGIGILEVDSEAMVHELTGNDPTILSGRGFSCEIYPMPWGAVHP